MKRFLKTVYDLIPLKQQLFSFLKLFFKPGEKVFKHLHFKGVFEVKITDNKKFKLEHFGYQIENEIFWQGLLNGWEKDSMKIWVKLCENSNTIIDVGANTGIYSLIAKCINPIAKVHAFEPISRVFDKLQKNCKLNDYDVYLVEKALSDNTGIAYVFDTPTDHIYSVTVNKNIFPEEVKVVKTEIETITLDDYIKKNSIENIDLVKIDVETHEPEVLDGFKEHLSKFKPTILIEVLNDEIGQEIEKRVCNLGYLYFNINEKGSIKRVNNITKSDYFNYLLCSEKTAKLLNLI